MAELLLTLRGLTLSLCCLAVLVKNGFTRLCTIVFWLLRGGPPPVFNGYSVKLVGWRPTKQEFRCLELRRLREELELLDDRLKGNKVLV